MLSSTSSGYILLREMSVLPFSMSTQSHKIFHYYYQSQKKSQKLCLLNTRGVGGSCRLFINAVLGLRCPNTSTQCNASSCQNQYKPYVWKLPNIKKSVLVHMDVSNVWFLDILLQLLKHQWISVENIWVSNGDIINVSGKQKVVNLIFIVSLSYINLIPNCFLYNMSFTLL